jgi:CRP-like cAMP-binding protein
MKKLSLADAPQNRVLNAFDSASRERIDPYIERLGANCGDVLCEVGSVINYGYFPDGAVLSLLTVLENGSAIETANIGREGAFGICLAQYSPKSPARRSSFSRCLVELPGGLLRVPLAVLRREVERCAQIRDLTARYEEVLLAQVQQTVACYAMHTTLQRVARWLLEMHDRADNDELLYTHEFLAHILGINRKSVTVAVQTFEKRGLIGHSRGRTQLRDCAALEREACECYAIIKKLRRSFECTSATDALRQLMAHRSNND